MHYQNITQKDLRHVERIERRLDFFLKKIESLIIQEENNLSPQDRGYFTAFKEQIDIAKNNLVRICAWGGELHTLINEKKLKAEKIQLKIDEALGNNQRPGLLMLISSFQQLERQVGDVSQRTQTQLLEEDRYPFYEAGFLRFGRKIYDLRKKLPEEFSESEDLSARSSMKRDDERLEQIVGGKMYSILHTHPRTAEEAKFRPSWFSPQDIIDFLQQKQYRTCIVAQRDPRRGKVAGYFFLRKSWRTPTLPLSPKVDLPNKTYHLKRREWEDHPLVKQVQNDLKTIDYPIELVGSKIICNVDEKLAAKLEAALLAFAKKYHLRFRAISVKGYVYKKGLGFVKKEN